VHAVIHHANAEEHGCRNKAVADHLDQRAFNGVLIEFLAGEHEKAQRHKAHVRNRRVRHQLFHVGLHQGDKADVNHCNQGQRDHHPRVFAAGIRQDRQRKPQKTISAQLERDRRQHHRAPRRRFDVRVRQPGMHWPHRHFHREGKEEGDQDQGLRAHAQCSALEIADFKAATGLVVEIDKGHQRQQ